MSAAHLARSESNDDRRWEGPHVGESDADGLVALKPRHDPFDVLCPGFAVEFGKVADLLTLLSAVTSIDHGRANEQHAVGWRVDHSFTDTGRLIYCGYVVFHRDCAYQRDSVVDPTVGVVDSHYISQRCLLEPFPKLLDVHWMIPSLTALKLFNDTVNHMCSQCVY